MICLAENTWTNTGGELIPTPDPLDSLLTYQSVINALQIATQFKMSDSRMIRGFIASTTRLYRSNCPLGFVNEGDD